MPEYPDDEDGAALTELAEQGVDMTQPLSIEFPVAAPNEKAAKAIDKALIKAGYVSQIEFDEGEPNEDGKIDPDDDEFGPSWTVFAIVSMIPEYNEIMRIQSDLDRLAGPLGGKSDGWGVLLEHGDDEDA